MSPPWGSQKLFQRLVSHELTAYLSNFYHFFESMSIVSKSCKPGNFDSHNSLKLRFCSNFLGCKSFLELNSPDFCKGRISRKPSGFLFIFLAGFTSIWLTSFSSTDYHLLFCPQFLMLFHLTYIRFSQSTHLLMYLSLKNFITSIIKTD